MLPGGGRNERQMQMMMRRLGMKTENVDDVQEVIIRTRDKEHVFVSPEVTILTVQGVRTYQVVGEPVTRPRSASAPSSGGAATSAAPPVAAGPPEEDIALVMEQAGVDREDAIDALVKVHGEPAEAILRLLSHKGGGGG